MAIRLPLKPQTPPSNDGPALKCESCAEILLKKTLEENLGICPRCQHHHRITARRRTIITIDPGTFEERYRELVSKDILSFRGAKSYESKLKDTRLATKEPSETIAGVGQIMGRPVAWAATDNFFIQGAMGSVLGEKLVRMAEDAIKEKLPFVIVSGSGGGACMYEGLFSLMQMAKTSAALGRLHEAKLPFISVLTDFTMGGVWASWAALGDIIMAEPKALVGFTGPRVIKETIKKDLPAGFQTSEFLLDRGQVDMIVERKNMRAMLAKVLESLCNSLPAKA